MILHVLPGDSLVSDFVQTGIEGDAVVCRECLVAGDVSGETLDEFWDRRSNFLSLEYGGDPIEYREHVAYELERLIGLSVDDEVNLWFEYELFCQANMWFCLDLLKGTEAAVYRVSPSDPAPDDVWKGFGKATSDDLRGSFDARTKFTKEDPEIGSRLWEAFRNRDVRSLKELSEYRSPCFPFLKEVCEAACEIDSRPNEIVRELIADGHKDLESLFPEFRKRAGVYGFGDSQVQQLMDAH